jgi:hypothetical protein
MATNFTADQIAHDNWNAYLRAKENGHNEYVKNAKKCDRFYQGGGQQWDDADRAYLEEQGKPVLEVNLILSTVNALIGEQTSQRVDIVYKPKKKSDPETAHALTAIAMAIQDDNRFEWVESQVFSDGIIGDRGFYDIRVDFSKDITGEVRITSEDPINILLDPDAKEYDPRTWNEVIKTKWFTLDEVETQYGKKARDEVEMYVQSQTSFGSDSIEYEEVTFGENDKWWGEYYQHDSGRDIRRVRVIERQYRRIGDIRCFVDNETGDISEIPEMVTDERAEEIAQQHNLSVITKKGRKIRWTVSCDGVTIMDEWSIYRSFTIVPYFPYFRRGKAFGVVRNLLSPQEQLNKLESQELHIVNTTANSGYTLEAGTLINMTEEELEKRGAETGLVLVHARGSNPPQKIQPNTVPTGIDRMSAKSAASIREISGVREEMLGSAKSEVSGVQLQAAQARGLVQMQVPFDNLAKTRHFVAEKILELIQDFYTETRVFAVLDRRDPMQGTKEVEINTPKADGSFLNDVTLGEYSVTISTAPARDSLEETQFAQAISLREAGVAIPDDVVIQNSNLQNKNEIAERVRNMQGMGEPTPEEAAMQEMQMQMLIQKAQLELAELEGKVMKLQADAMLASARAEKEGRSGEEAQQQFALEIAKIKAQMNMKVADLNTSLQLAGIHTQAGLQETLLNNLTKRTIGELSNRKDVAVAGLSAQAKAQPPKPEGKSTNAKEKAGN